MKLFIQLKDNQSLSINSIIDIADKVNASLKEILNIHTKQWYVLLFENDHDAINKHRGTTAFPSVLSLREKRENESRRNRNMHRGEKVGGRDSEIRSWGRGSETGGEEKKKGN